MHIDTYNCYSKVKFKLQEINVPKLKLDNEWGENWYSLERWIIRKLKFERWIILELKISEWK